MKITFTDMQNIAREVVGLTDTATTTKIKRDINVGASKLLAAIGREYNRKSRFTNLVVNQQFYQMPEDAQKLKEIIVSTGGWSVPLEQIADEHAWRQVNMTPIVGNPTHFFIKGFDQVGLFPTPSQSIVNGIELVFSPQHIEMTQDDYITGTVSVSNGSQTITGAGTQFTANMVGQWFQVTDGTDENWYRISAFNSATSLNIENYYQGLTGITRTFRIGQTIDFPGEYAEAPSDYACYRHYLQRGDTVKANTFKQTFDAALEGARDNYGATTDQQVIYSESQARFYNPFRGDPPPGGISA